YSGRAERAPGTPHYLRAAAATESRAFPTFVHDPARGSDRASRFSLTGNPQPEAGWPVHHLCYEDEDLQRIAEDTAFTFVDFAATDSRYAESFIRVPRAEWCDAMLPVAEFLELDPADAAEKQPYVLLIDDDDVLHRAVVEAKLIEAARRCREMWRNLQELAAPARSPVDEIEPPTPETESEPAPQSIEESTDEPAETPAVSTDEPHIETARCTTCDECTQI
ncbi:MAG: hypothetical protein GY953_19995, partial [bacterium]|nr:hypothetical protein [bacterium]